MVRQVPGPYDSVSWEAAYRDAQSVLERQLGSIRELDVKAAQLVKGGSALLGLLAAAAALAATGVGVARLETGPAYAVQAMLLAGVLLLGLALVLASRVFLRGPLIIGISPRSFRELASDERSPEFFYQRALKTYADALERNEQFILRASRWLYAAWTSFGVGTSLGALASAGLFLSLSS